MAGERSFEPFNAMPRALTKTTSILEKEKHRYLLVAE